MPTRNPTIQIPQGVRRIPADYEGLVVISDIDKTYLATKIESLGGLLRTAFETAETKENVPGFSIILRALRRGAGTEPVQNPLFFVSASPPQIGGTLQAKMELDGVEHDGIVFKNQLAHVRTGAFRKLREQIGYKLEALLSLWKSLPHGSQILLFGDDSESDAVVYSLFTEILASKAVRGQVLFDLLLKLGVFREEALRVSWISRNVGEPCQPIRMIFINLDSGSQASYYSRLGPHFYPCENSLQTALALFEQGHIRDRAVRSVGRELLIHYDFEPRRLLESLRGGALRGLYSTGTLRKAWPILHSVGALPEPEELVGADGELSRLSPQRWHLPDDPAKALQELRRRYSDEGRY